MGALYTQNNGQLEHVVVLAVHPESASVTILLPNGLERQTELGRVQASTAPTAPSTTPSASASAQVPRSSAALPPVPCEENMLDDEAPVRATDAGVKSVRDLTGLMDGLCVECGDQPSVLVSKF